MIRTPLRPLARILSARQAGQDPDEIEAELRARRHAEIQDRARRRAEGRLRWMVLGFVLAFGTVSQLGLLTVVLGFGTRDVALGGIALLLSHALFKSCLFLIVGIIDRQLGTRDIDELSGVGRQAPPLATVSFIAIGSMIGVEGGGEREELRLTPLAAPLRRIYGERDLLTSLALSAGVFDDLDPAALAAAVTAVVHEGKREATEFLGGFAAIDVPGRS